MSEPNELPDSTEAAVTPWQERRGVLAVLVGALVAIVVLGGYFFIFSGGSDEPSSEITAINEPAAPVVPSPSATPTPTNVPAVFDGDLGRDPFAPLYPPAESTGGGGSDAAAPVDVPTPGNQAIPDVAPALPPSQPLPDAAPATGGSTSDPVRITLVSIDGTDSAVVKVGSERTTVGKGDTFATTFKVDALYPDEKLATFRYGDVSFSLKVGQSATF
jgi:hypothetical protein